ncbi:MAG: VWA domain-containing protein [Fuerstiella sp.]|nr:VWA domain-containing protein [Fuerstiella sp.]
MYVQRATNAGEQDRRGAMLPLIVICLPVILAFSAYAVNIAWMQLTRTELRTATDAAARAGSRMLSRTQDTDIARSVAIDAASRNTVAGNALALDSADVTFGTSAPDAAGDWLFTQKPEDTNGLNGVHITGRRTSGSASGSVPMLFTGLFDRGHFEPVKTAVASHMDRDVMLVLDRSGSMARRTPGGNRWRDMKRAVTAFLSALISTPQDELVGVATYSTSSTLDENMTLNYAQLTATIDKLSVGGWTAIGKGLQDGIAGITDPSFARANAAKTIVVMTDGQHNRGIMPEIVARKAHDTYGITVHTITFSRSADRSHMQLVARNGGGRHWHADDQAELIAVFEEIANNLPTLLTE